MQIVLFTDTAAILNLLDLRSITGFEIYFHVQLPLGQPQDLVWFPIEYFGCASSCPSSIQETNTDS